MTILAAPFRKAAHCLDHLAFAVVDSPGKHVVQLAQELRHLIREEFQSSVRVDTVKHRRRPVVLRTFDSLRESETRIADHRQFDTPAWPGAPART
ncbi:hypothetical protein ACTOB_003545 [Actinoplanes oblitus]|uniref:Uncharacterized protein n=1 Tax=Actinoplanes oblitus TaxID=3040509 RepID=A0ABY8WQE5_9ACTN|nr:hypothetical protein [Actinoplanes oblitus]WIM99878.1 hypothetical protein ACTOB_003545 [Actinoplanes oblitus]